MAAKPFFHSSSMIPAAAFRSSSWLPLAERSIWLQLRKPSNASKVPHKIYLQIMSTSDSRSAGIIEELRKKSASPPLRRKSRISRASGACWSDRCRKVNWKRHEEN